MDELFLSALRELSRTATDGEDETLKVLLTGALGSIGFSTLAALLAEGHDVVAFDLESRRARSLHPASTDGLASSGATSPVRNRCRHALEGVAAVIHLAAIIPPLLIRRPSWPAG